MLNGCAYILTVDVGNTFIRFGLFAEDSAAAQECPLATCEITTPSSITADEARMRLVQVMAALAARGKRRFPAPARGACSPWGRDLRPACPCTTTIRPRSAPTASPMLWRHAPSTARRAL